jgi:hypothetical protein
MSDVIRNRCDVAWKCKMACLFRIECMYVTHVNWLVSASVPEVETHQGLMIMYKFMHVIRYV